MKILKQVGLFLLDFIETIVIALSIFVIVYIFLFQPHQVKGGSMLPNFEDGEYLLTNKIVYRLNDPHRGDVIVFSAPQNQNYDYIKRIIGLPGEVVSIRSGRIYINNEVLDETSYLDSTILSTGGRFLGENRAYELKQEEYFVLGDNRNQSSDSRDWGPIKTDNIVGKAWIVYWPASKIGMVEKAVYTLGSKNASNILLLNNFGKI
jgi:signal peptidase I